jgi:hypothetical protein
LLADATNAARVDSTIKAKFSIHCITPRLNEPGAWTMQEQPNKESKIDFEYHLKI